MTSSPAAPAPRARLPRPRGSNVLRRLRPRSLRTRLIVSVLGLLLIIAAVMGTVSTLALRHTLMTRLDEQLIAASQRAEMRRHGSQQPADSSDSADTPPDGAQDSDSTAEPDDGTEDTDSDGTEDTDSDGSDGTDTDDSSDSDAAGSGTTPRTGPPSDAAVLAPPTRATDVSVSGQTAAVVPDTGKPDSDGKDGKDCDSGGCSPGGGHDKIPAGLDAAGQPIGTLTLISSGDAGGATASQTSTVTAGYIDPGGHYRSLTLAEREALLSLEPDGRPVTVDIDSLGEYRVLVSQDSSTGDVVITGLSTEPENSVVRTQLLIEGLIVAVGTVAVVLAGRVMVRSALAPLERVATTAQRVASQPLARGEVSIESRVPEADIESSKEVGQVGEALNTLLDHVDDALTARQRSETQVRQFVADASHELRTPLAAIRGYTELIARGGGDAALPENAVHALDRIHSESLRITRLVEDLLLLARLDAGRELEHEEVDLVGILLDTVSDARAAGPDHVWELDLAALDAPEGIPEDDLEDFEPEPPLVTGDEARLRQVLVNLLANARVHTPPGSRVRTTLTRRGPGAGSSTDNSYGELVVTITDDGPGIDPTVRNRLFERFARGDASRVRATGSTGLGMSIALAIVQSHNGTLTVESRRAPEEAPEGTPHGTTFTVTLPAAPTD